MPHDDFEFTAKFTGFIHLFKAQDGLLWWAEPLENASDRQKAHAICEKSDPEKLAIRTNCLTVLPTKNIRKKFLFIEIHVMRAEHGQSPLHLKNQIIANVLTHAPQQK